ncbi:MAG: class I SAM-dependent methyltransferase [Anaerolineae bacterium]
MRLFPPAWTDYGLIDSGNGRKLERFGPYTLIRPEPGATWHPTRHWDWERADAQFNPTGSNQGAWQILKPMLPRWEIQFSRLRFWVAPTPFRHVGVFPEQAPQWKWLQEVIQSTAGGPSRALSLFGYTGIATLSMAEAGANVAHVDSSKKAVQWARENAALSGLEAFPIRWIVEDAMKFVQREVRRGAKYEVIVLDPPPIGHGTRGESWLFERDMPKLLEACRKLLAERPLAVLITAYTAKTSPIHLRNMLHEMIMPHHGQLEFGDVALRDLGGHELPQAYFARWRTTS